MLRYSILYSQILILRRDYDQEPAKYEINIRYDNTHAYH